MNPFSAKPFLEQKELEFQITLVFAESVPLIVTFAIE